MKGAKDQPFDERLSSGKPLAFPDLDSDNASSRRNARCPRGVSAATFNQGSANKEDLPVSWPRAGVCVGVVALAGLLQTSVAAQAIQPLTGTWKLNLEKSTFNPPDLAVPSLLVTYEIRGDRITASLDGVDANRSAVHSEYTATFDGKEHPITGTIDGKPAPNQDAISWKRIDDRTYEVVNKTSDQVITTRRIVVAADGKSRTTTITGRDAQGRTVHHVMFFDRQ
jgi:hypothetical protein